MRDVKGFLSRKQSEGGPLVSEWVALGELYEKKLWHQLTTKLTKFVKNEHFAQNGGLVEMYENFLADFEHRINMLSLMEIVLYIIKEIKEPETAIEFLEREKEKIKNDIEAEVLCMTAIGNIKLQQNNMEETKALVEQARGILDTIDGVTTVHGRFYELCSNYHKITGSYNDYYRDALRFLGCVEISTMAASEQVNRALHLSLAALLGNDIYNFGELLAHPVLQSLKGTEHGWLIDLLFAFNSGDLAKFEQLRPHWQKQADLNRNYKSLRQKISLLCLMEKDNFGERFAQELKAKITRETADNPLLKTINGRHDSRDETAEEKARRKKKKEKERDREARETKETKKSEVKEVHKETKKHKEPKDYKETTGLDKQSKKASLLPSTSQSSSVLQQELSAAAAASTSRQSNSPPHILHATAGASTSNVPTSLYGGASGPSAPAPTLDTFVTGPPHGKQLSPIQSASTIQNSPTQQDPPGAALSKGSIGTITTSQGTSTKGSSSHAVSLSKTNIGLGVVGPRHESPPGPPPFRVANDSKVKKTPPSYSKKTNVPAPNHHSTPLYSTSDSYYDQRTSSNFDLGSRHGERSSLESNYKKKRDKDKEKERERPRGENEFPHLPDVPGAEAKNSLKTGKSSKSVKTSISMMPHITNLTPFQNGTSQRQSTPPGYHQGNSHDSNLPSV